MYLTCQFDMPLPLLCRYGNKNDLYPVASFPLNVADQTLQVSHMRKQQTRLGRLPAIKKKRKIMHISAELFL